MSDTLRDRFHLSPTAEFSVEIDPRGLDEARIDAFALAGVDRISIGVQDFDPTVQAAINRIQTFEETRACIEGFRDLGVEAINLDLIYGLPYQTRASIDRTIDDVLRLAPSRIALFGYAHVPWMKAQQRLIPDDALPDVVERFAQANHAAHRLVAAGFVRIGIDHFARPDDPLARAAEAHRLRRNFQGYTDDPCEALIGLGASSISMLPQGHVQNIAGNGAYIAATAEGLPTAKGYALTKDDRLRSHVIERLMCDFAFSADELRTLFGDADGLVEAVLETAEDLVAFDPEARLRREGERFFIHPPMRPFVRTVAAAFDTFFAEAASVKAGRHSVAV